MNDILLLSERPQSDWEGLFIVGISFEFDFDSHPSCTGFVMLEGHFQFRFSEGIHDGQIDFCFPTCVERESPSVHGWGREKKQYSHEIIANFVFVITPNRGPKAFRMFTVAHKASHETQSPSITQSFSSPLTCGMCLVLVERYNWAKLFYKD